MKQVDLIIKNPTGLHARPAAVFVKAAKKFKASIKLNHGKKSVNAKNMLSVLTLGVERGGQIQLIIDGPDEDEALSTLQSAIESGLGDSLDEDHGHSAPAETPATPSVPAQQNGTSAPTPVSTDKNLVQGVPGASGIAIGPIHHLSLEPQVNKAQTSQGAPAEEEAKLLAALAQARKHIQELQSEVSQRLSQSEAAIFDAHLAIVDDSDLQEAAQSDIQVGQSAVQAWQAAIENQAQALAKLKDPLLAARATDVRDAGSQVLRALAGSLKSGIHLPEHPVIILADDLTPSITASLDKSRVLGFCTAQGGANAHTAILARALALPAVVGAGLGILDLDPGTMAILDGQAGTLRLNPSNQLLTEAIEIQNKAEKQQAQALSVAHEPATTQDGHQVEVVANIGGLDDAKQAYEFGAEGVGLLRTEFLFLKRDTPPSVEEQYEVYKSILLALHQQPVILRTLDVGGDKPLAYLPVPEEQNPFLGQRGIRLCLAKPELLETQLRAIFYTAQHGPCRVMFPMISSISEWYATQEILKPLKAEFPKADISFGIMIEVPSAALLAHIFAEEVDFFSIGTNDLTQYTLAIDRTNQHLSTQADGLHPAVLHLIDRTVQAAHQAGKWVGVCGELGADPQAVPILVGLGVDELSVNVPAIPAVKAQIRNLNLSKAKDLAQKALTQANADAVRQLITV